MPLTLHSIPTAPDDQKAAAFLSRQSEQYGGNLQLEPNVWALLVVAHGDPEETAIVRDILASATFAHEVRESEDGALGVYCVDGANRSAASFWLDDTYRAHSGRIRGLAPSHASLVDEILKSPMPHRFANNLVDLHAKGEVAAGAIRQPSTVRSLLDRLHLREPLYISAFLALLDHHLFDLVVLNRKLEKEDVELGNDLTRGSVSKDPFFQSRQTTASQIRNHLVRCHMINPIDQQKGAATHNPYAYLTDVRLKGNEVILRVDGIDQAIGTSEFLGALRKIRKNVNRGARLEEVDTHTPWMTDEIGYPLRFIRGQISSNPAISALDMLYMIERAVDPDGL
ncbi:MAG TPA: hypothetical protein VGG34_15510 [Opitutaceae bacterium]